MVKNKSKNFWKDLKHSFIINFVSMLIIIIFATVFNIGKLSLIMTDSVGLYRSKTSWIAINVDNKTPSEIEFTIHHEIGHHIYSQCLNNTIKKEYENTIFSKITECEIYYPNNINEDFAESYACYKTFCFQCNLKNDFFKRINIKECRGDKKW